MGNAIGGRAPIIDEESASVAESAAHGARNAVFNAHHQLEAAGVSRTAGGRAGEQVTVGGVLPLHHAADAAAEGAAHAVQVVVRLLPPSRRALLTPSDLRQIEAASAAGASAGVRGAAFMASMYAPPRAIPPAVAADHEAPPAANQQGHDLDLERVAAAAAAGAWNGTFASLQAISSASMF